MCLCEIYSDNLFLGEFVCGKISAAFVFLEMKYVGSSVIEYLEGVG